MLTQADATDLWSVQPAKGGAWRVARGAWRVARGAWSVDDPRSPPEVCQRAQIQAAGPVLGGTGRDKRFFAAADAGASGEHVEVGGLDLVEDGGAHQANEGELHIQVVPQLLEQR